MSNDVVIVLKLMFMLYRLQLRTSPGRDLDIAMFVVSRDIEDERFPKIA